MYTHDHVGSTPKSIECETMAQLRIAILADHTLDERRRGEMASALRGLGKGLHQQLEVIPTDPALLRPLLADRPASMAGFSTGRWRNIRSLTDAALAHVGKTTVPGRSHEALSPAWQTLLDGLPEYGDRYRLGRFGRYCSEAGIEPDAVNDEVLDGFLADLTARSLAAEPARIHREVALAWNRCGEAQPLWPTARLTVADNRNHYALPWDRFPVSLKADVDAWIDHLSGADPMAEIDFRPLRPASLLLCRKQVHLLISAQVLQGEDAAGLRTLADVVAPDRVNSGLRFLRDRAGGKAMGHAAKIAGMATSVARHWVKADQEDLVRLKRIHGNIRRQIAPAHQGGGMTDRNRARLRPFNDPAVLGGVLDLPRTIRDEVLRAGAPTKALAKQLQTAIAIDILTVIPLRMKNLVSLRIDVHLLRGSRGDLTLVLPAEEVKNRNIYELPVPAETVKLIDLYLKRYRPLLAGEQSDFLFPGRKAGRPKTYEGLRHQISRCLLMRRGLAMHPHLFRHLAAKVILDNDPGAYGQVQRILGHKSLATTMQSYSGMEQAAAFAHFGKLLETKRAGRGGTPAVQSRRQGAR